ncbi:MAG TPA: MoaD/ThiS family protein [Chloroflexota bacterium]|nr:MoaD/ThiS family protein [Chloroflexota bacterium]
MIDVRVRVYATLRQYLPTLSVGQSAELSLPEGATVADTLDHLGIPRVEVRNSFVNGLQRELDWPLHDRDELALFPPIGGG